MRIVYFTHSLASCWNHGNAHFLRGVLRELIGRGHDVEVFEPADSWSLRNLLADHGRAGLSAYHAAYPELSSTRYGGELDLSAALSGADLVIVHEWNDPALVAAIGLQRARGGRFILLFHDTHHRAVSDQEAIRALDISGYDGVLAFGEALAEVYRRWGWGRRAFVWHEAADVSLFHPAEQEVPREGLVWIGNWGDGERARELTDYLLTPAHALRLPLDVFGVRYPPEALALLRSYGARYRGWLPNAHAPEAFTRHFATLHVPRRFYVERLPGIPTIRVFEALACGIPLICAPWSDVEGLLRPGQDFLIGRDPQEIEAHLRALQADPALRASLVRAGLESILSRHTCAHRVDELMEISAQIGGPVVLEAAG